MEVKLDVSLVEDLGVTPVGPGTPSMGVGLIQEDHPAGGAHSGEEVVLKKIA